MYPTAQAMLRVRASLGSGRGSPLVSVTKVSASLPVCSVIDPVLKQGVVAGAVETDAVPALLECAAGSTAGESKEITALHEDRESDFSKTDGVVFAVATAGESDRNLGLRPVLESHSRRNSSWGVDVIACARVSALPGVSATASSSSSSASAFVSVAGVAHARSTTMHDAHNSWSDTAMNSLRVQR